jgi:lactoylglutathione lyase
MMIPIPQGEAMRIARELISEAYAGPTPEWSWFVNTEPDSGVFGSIKNLTAEQASAEPSPGGRSIAAHVEHLRWSLETVNRTLRGEPWEPDWSASWTVQTVDDFQWQSLQAALRKEFEELRNTLNEDLDVSDPRMFQGLFALAPHAAYHLGTIRQIARSRAMPGSPATFNLFVLRSRDLNRARAFYSALGVEFTEHSHGRGPVHLANETDGRVFEIYPLTEKDVPTSSARIGFSVPSVDDAYQSLLGVGGQAVSSPRNSPWGRRAVVADPDDHRVELTASVK